MRLAEIKNGIVTNIAEVDPDNIPDFMAGWPEVSDAGPGWTHDGTTFAPPSIDPAEALAAERARMVATRRQVRLALGEAGCAAMDAAADDPDLPWAMREQIKSSHEWHRSAPEIDEFGWVMGLDANDIDALFQSAMSL